MFEEQLDLGGSSEGWEEGGGLGRRKQSGRIRHLTEVAVRRDPENGSDFMSDEVMLKEREWAGWVGVGKAPAFTMAAACRVASGAGKWVAGAAAPC